MGNSQEPQDFNISVMPSSLTPVHVAKAAEGLNLYDTASHQVSHFVPLKPGEVGIYVCGATVQSSPHIGHIRAAVAFDIVRRWFLKLGYKVTFVRNVTDIDDKILVKAAAAGQRWWARAYYYEREFTEAYNTLGVLPPTVEPRATGHMSDMIDLIQRILDNGHGYVVTDADGKPTGNVYFDVASWPHYGELTHQKQTSEVDEAAAVADRMGPSVDATGADKYNPVDPADASPDKHDPRDFALWKAPKDTDPEDARWSTPFGVGRPGWHIECSAMSHRYLGDGFDIHGGGLDLRFPHHENEIAQTEAALGKPLANIWMHNGFVQVDSEKMSKSLGNFKTIRDILESYLAETLRYFLAGKHYRSPIDFSLDNMDESERSQKRVYECLREVDKALARENWKPGAAPAELVEELKQQDQSFMDALEDDVNTAAAMGHLFNMVRIAGRVLEDKKLRNSEGGRDILRAFRDATAKWDTLLGLFAQKPEGFLASLREIRARRRGLDMNKVAGLLRERQEARAAKDFARSDAARDELAALGVEVRDTPEGPVWDII